MKSGSLNTLENDPYDFDDITIPSMPVPRIVVTYQRITNAKKALSVFAYTVLSVGALFSSMYAISFAALIIVGLKSADLFHR